MNIFNLNKDEFKKIDKEFRKTYIGQYLYIIRVCIFMLFIFAFGQEIFNVLNDSFDLVFTLVILCAVLLYAILDYLYYIILNSYYKDKKVVSKK